MQRDKARVDQLMQVALDMAAKAFGVDSDEGESDGYVVAGETNLLSTPNDSEAMRKLFDAFSRKRDILHLLDRCLDSEGIQLFIGDESGYEVLGDYSVVTAPYRVNGRVAGVLGVIGPTRMAYQRVIPDRRRDGARAGRRPRSHLSVADLAFEGLESADRSPHYRKPRKLGVLLHMSEDKSSESEAVEPESATRMPHRRSMS